MIDSTGGHGLFESTDFIKYDPLNPSPLFTKSQINFIESPYKHFDDHDLKFIRSFEWFILNKKTLDMNYDDIPGFRKFSDTDCVYVRRFNDDPYKSMIWDFLDYIPDNYPDGDINKLIRPSVRIFIDNEDRYYPIEYRGDLEQWRRRMTESAAIHDTLLGRFERGKFAVSDGRKLEFSTLRIERCGETALPGDW